ncbi:MAG: tRNA (uridine(54)-C5)-methyltransferase TrmA [Porticoccaceae bacterium]
MTDSAATTAPTFAEKTTCLRQLLSGLDCPAPEPFDSPASGYRMRAEFRIWHEDGSAHYAMHRRGEKRPYTLTEFPIGYPLLRDLMSPLLAAINSEPLLSRKLFGVEFLTGLSGDALITLLYHRPLENDWEAVAKPLQQRLGAAIIGRSRKQKVVLSRDFIEETLVVDELSYYQQQVENSFTQPNAVINQKMLSWAAAQCKDSAGDLLELYCGNGNFTSVLASQFKRILATEISKTSVRSAEHNFARNQIDNVTVVRMSSEEISQALAGVRPFRRLAAIDLPSYSFSTLLVDPPRAGLDAGTLALAARFERILYISCNPETLARDLRQLDSSHRIEALAAFDQFPGTAHLESGALLIRR